LVVLRTKAPQDKAAVRAWIQENVDADNAEEQKKADEMMNSLGKLQNGEAWVWHTDEPYVFAKFLFRKRKTFHATREFIKSPEAANVKLMDASAFIAKFRAVFKEKGLSAPSLVHASVGSSVDKAELETLHTELEEFRSGRKLAESVQGRLKFLGEVKLDLEKKIKGQEEELKLYDELKSVLRRMFPKGIPENPFLPSSNIPESNQVGLQKVTKIVDVAEVKKSVGVFQTDTVKGKVLFLTKENGFFKSWRNLGEVNKELTERAWSCSSAAVSQALSELVDAGIFGVRKTDRNEYKLAPDVVFEGLKEAS
jgi:hypothetical protein